MKQFTRSTCARPDGAHVISSCRRWHHQLPLSHHPQCGSLQFSVEERDDPQGEYRQAAVHCQQTYPHSWLQPESVGQCWRSCSLDFQCRKVHVTSKRLAQVRCRWWRHCQHLQRSCGACCHAWTCCSVAEVKIGTLPHLSCSCRSTVHKWTPKYKNERKLGKSRRGMALSFYMTSHQNHSEHTLKNNRHKWLVLSQLGSNHSVSSLQ